MTENFSSIPILDYSLSTSPGTRPEFLRDLRDALIKVGFFYLQNHQVPTTARQDLLNQSQELFDLSPEKKSEIDMSNSKHFVGYVGLDQSTTSKKQDHRETYTLGYEQPAPGPNEPVYRNLQGPNLWPDKKILPRFKPVIETYMAEVAKLADEFKVLIAEALGIHLPELMNLFDAEPFGRLTLAKYSKPESGSEEQLTQGKGRHKDSGFLTFLLPGTPHMGLEAMNAAGEWIPVPPIPGAMIINVGVQLEALTDGVCNAAIHRVLVQRRDFIDDHGHDMGPRFSFPLFLTISLNKACKKPLDLPQHILAMVTDDDVRQTARSNLQRLFQGGCAGNRVFNERLRVYRKAAHKWWPDHLAEALQQQLDKPVYTIR
ncbi:putative oxidoreductase [Aspergillus pseudotamarii]|uniref:Putative oxidoreductase n=1 Tax=Aspergillus pseudotamarii TaxID=132259 RepID=A0A5N6SVK5_ASPPS|nr:putative oxidoreductase [Aspergillus pseudotamarii]KAE8137811.1 putative oxidoreductase [Aspergillus pseudotamarii]